mmetsp:Transcript_10175/g.20853  ORF Transcript_10175/g.20853 Transcript_10175/m.20853 type:complete len:223 (+) Transcript_10175:247-915(+)
MMTTTTTKRTTTRRRNQRKNPRKNPRRRTTTMTTTMTTTRISTRTRWRRCRRTRASCCRHGGEGATPRASATRPSPTRSRTAKATTTTTIRGRAKQGPTEREPVESTLRCGGECRRTRCCDLERSHAGPSRTSHSPILPPSTLRTIHTRTRWAGDCHCHCPGRAGSPDVLAGAEAVGVVACALHEREGAVPDRNHLPPPLRTLLALRHRLQVVRARESANAP